MKTKILFVSLVLSAFLLSSCGSKKSELNEEQLIPVKTVKVEYKEYAIPVISSGVVTSKREARLSFKTGGIINKLYVKMGDQVRKGQLLATLDMTEINAQVTQAKNGRDKAQRDFDRVNNLFIENAATMEQKQNVQTGLDVAEQSLRIAKFNQQYSSIYATESGRAIQKFMNEGELASPGAPVFLINSSCNEDWALRIGVSDKDWARIKKGDKACLSIDAYPGEVFSAFISEISEAADPYSGTFQVELQIKPNGKKLANGLVAKAEITPSKTDKLFVIPIESLTESNRNEGNIFTTVNNSNTVKKQKVQIVKIMNDKVAVKSGLENVSEVITEGLAYLSADSKIKVIGN